MSEKTFTKIEIANYKKYERVRAGGRYNMFDPRAMAATGLIKEEYLAVMRDFTELHQAALKDAKTN